MRLPNPRRQQFIAFAMLSLLACGAMAGEFVRSFWIADELQCYANSADGAVATRRSTFIRFDLWIAADLISIEQCNLKPDWLSGGRVSYQRQIDMPGMERHGSQRF